MTRGEYIYIERDRGGHTERERERGGDIQREREGGDIHKEKERVKRVRGTILRPLHSL